MYSTSSFSDGFRMGDTEHDPQPIAERGCDSYDMEASWSNTDTLDKDEEIDGMAVIRDLTLCDIVAISIKTECLF